MRMTVQAIVRADGHVVTDDAWDVVVTDELATAERLSQHGPVLMLTPVTGVRDVVQAMQRGVYGYVLTPLVPGEVNVMVARALSAAGRTASTEPEPPMTLAETEARHIRDTLRRCRYNQAKAARVLGIGRNTLWRKLKQMGDLPE